MITPCIICPKPCVLRVPGNSPCYLISCLVRGWLLLRQSLLGAPVPDHRGSTNMGREPRPSRIVTGVGVSSILFHLPLRLGRRRDPHRVSGPACPVPLLIIGVLEFGKRHQLRVLARGLLQPRGRLACSVSRVEWSEHGNTYAERCQVQLHATQKDGHVDGACEICRQF